MEVLSATTFALELGYIHFSCHIPSFVMKAADPWNWGWIKGFFNKHGLMLTYLQKKSSKQIAQNEYYILLGTLLLRVKLDVPSHMTVCIYPRETQCAAVSTYCGEIRLQLQKDPLSIRRAPWYGNWPAYAGKPPTIFGAWTFGAPSEIEMNPMVLISLTTKFVYMPTHKIAHNS